MSTNYSKRRDTHIDLDSAGAQDPPATDDVARMNHGKPLDGPSAPKRLKKKQQDAVKSTGPTHEHKNSANNSSTVVPVAPKSPWDTYQKLYDLQLGDVDYFTVAEKINPDLEKNPVVIIKTFTGTTAESRAQAIHRIRHNRFVDPQLFFPIDGGYLVSFEFMPLALSEIAGSPLLNDLRLASALGQIVDGLLYLEQNALEHSQLTCSNILVDCFGNVKLWGQEHIRSSLGACQHLKAVGDITMYLAHGYDREDGHVGLDHPHRFPLTFEFLSATERTSMTVSITQEPLLKLPWHRRRLAGLVSLANTWVGCGYRFPARATEVSSDNDSGRNAQVNDE